MTPSASAPTKEEVIPDDVRDLAQEYSNSPKMFRHLVAVLLADRRNRPAVALAAPVCSPDVGTETEHLLSSLLARIHRDGGHYEVQHGTEKAVRDADEIIADLYASPQPPGPASVRVTEEMVKRMMLNIFEQAAVDHRYFVIDPKMSMRHEFYGVDMRKALEAALASAEPEGCAPGLTAEVERLREALRRAKPFLASRELVDESKFGKGCSAATPVLQAARTALGEA